MLAPEQLNAAREWVKDCAGSFTDIETEEDVDALTEAQVIRGIARHFDGGLPAFVATFEPFTPEAK